MAINVLNIPVFCINLDRRPERWLNFSKQPGVLEMPNIVRFSAVDGKKLVLEDNDKISVKTKYNIMNNTRRSHVEIDTIGAVGCTMSHASIWKIFLDRHAKSEYCLIFEDDIRVEADFSKMIHQLSGDLSTLPNGLDIWLLQYSVFRENRFKGLTDTWVMPTNFFGTGAYIVSRNGAQKLLEHVYPIEMQVDGYMQTLANIGELNIVINRHIRIRAGNSKSDIQTGGCQICDVPNKMKDAGLKVVNKSVLIGLIGYGLAVTLLVLYKCTV